MAYLTDQEVTELVDIAVREDLDSARHALFPPPEMQKVRAALPKFAQPKVQMRSDLQKLSDISRTPGGVIPIERWLSVASTFVVDADSKRVVDNLLDKVIAAAEGTPDVTDDVITDDIKEKIVLFDDLVPFEFLNGGFTAGLGVGRVKVLPFENGAPMLTSGSHSPHLGTAWLLTSKLVMTNHHVVNARSKSPLGGSLPIAGSGDLSLQGKNAVIEWDFISDDVEPVRQKFSGVTAVNQELDYAVLELADESDRTPLPLVPDDIDVAGIDERKPVNIIQHPGGDVKKVGLRNNLILKTTDKEVHYFTDTRRGSSGSPVMNDQWQVVALHKAARRVSGVKFQGKSTAYVNVGTKIQKIIDDIKLNNPGVL